MQRGKNQVQRYLETVGSLSLTWGNSHLCLTLLTVFQVVGRCTCDVKRLRAVLFHSTVCIRLLSHTIWYTTKLSSIQISNYYQPVSKKTSAEDWLIEAIMCTAVGT